MRKGTGLLALMAVGGALALPGAASAETQMDAMQRQIEELQRQLLDLKAKQAQTEQRQVETEKRQETALTEDDLKGTMPGSIRIPGTNTSLKIGGYVKLDGIYDLGPSMGGTVTADSMPLDGDRRREGAFGYNVRQTRLNVTTETPFEDIKVRSVLEFDFYGGGGNEANVNSATPRLRHAYVTAGPFLVGQTWSTAYDLAAAGEKLDFGGLPGEQAVRQPQVRYTSVSGPDTFAIALENPESDFIGNVPANNSVTAAAGSASGIADPNFDQVPDLVIRYAHKFDWGHLAVLGIGRQITAETVTADESVFGYGLGLSGTVKFFEKDVFGFQVLGGEGINRYLNLAYRQSASFDGSSLEALTSWGGNVSVKHYWADTMRSTLIFAYQRIDNNDVVPLTANKELMTFHANFIATVVPSLDVGLEYIHAHRETEAGAEGSADRLQASVIYNF
ncbi:DcaP family trimeric outer membrane transporter [Oleomonas cavernae]|nr:DcaP family trimeric outer membrane transporter [Oleomonas cavernae]